MTDQQDHPITPPPELVQKWIAEIWHEGTPVQVAHSDLHIATRAAQWGADQELKACCKWLQCEAGDSATEFVAGDLRAARRPKPTSLAEQGMEALRSTPCTEQRHYDALFAALNRLAELEDSND